MDRFAAPHFTDGDELELCCENPDCCGRKGETVRVRFLARIVSVQADEDGVDQETLEDCCCPYCGREGSRA